MTASLYFRAKSIADVAKEEKMKDLQGLKTFIDRFQSNVKEEIEKAKTDLENKSKKQ